MQMRYRVWDTWTNGFVDNGAKHGDEVYLSPDGLPYVFESDDGGIHFRPEYDEGRFIVSLSTGIKGKDGVEIYEGDILKVEGWGIYDVRFDCGYVDAREGWRSICLICGFYLANARYELDKEGWETDKTDLPNFPPSIAEDDRELKVIGNIYEGAK